MRRGRIALAVAAGVVVAALVGEIALRLAWVGPRREAFGPWRRRVPWESIRAPAGDGSTEPVRNGYARWAIHPWSAPVTYRLDRHGFRVVAGDGAPAGPGRCRVLVAGESNAFGYAVAADEALPSRLERVLREREVAATVANAGVSGSNVRQQRRWLARWLRELDVDVLVLVASPWSLRVDSEPPARDATVSDKLWNVVELESRRAAAYSSLADRGRHRVGHLLHRLVAWPPAQRVAWELEPLVEDRARFSARWREVASEVTAILSLAADRGARAVVAYVPLDVQMSRSRNAVYRSERLPYLAYGFLDRDYTADDRYAALGDLVAGEGAPFVDATAALRAEGESAFLEDDYHLGPVGHARVAAALADAVAAACPPPAAAGERTAALHGGGS